MGLLKKAPASDAASALLRDREPSCLALVCQRLEVLLTSGGDPRLKLSRSAGRNAYGCTPFPRTNVIDFASSTASSISERAYARANDARSRLWSSIAVQPHIQAFEESVETSRRELRRQLGLGDAEIVFSPSGTDAQLQTLFLVKALLGAPLTTIIVGADQTGSGTAHTARGEHFSDRTACGIAVDKGMPVAELASDVRTQEVGFCDDRGRLRSADAMDAEVRRAVSMAVGRGEKVLLQVMDASKLGWAAPGDACVSALAQAWPDDVRVVVDACQMRLGQNRLRAYLSRGYLVMITGSKFFTGPAFSGALLVPPALAQAARAISAVPQGLRDYSSRFDWPPCWPFLRAAFAPEPQYGQWLRWEAALAEMGAYFEIPAAFRQSLFEEFAVSVRRMIGASRHLELLERFDADGKEDSEFRHQTIFSFLPHRQGVALDMEQCARLYRAMGEDVSQLLPAGADDEDCRIASRHCQIGQPVALRHRSGAVLRLSASARLATRCWSRGAATAAAALAPERSDLAATVEKLDWLIDHPDILEHSCP
jgi:hypothetical protein